MGKAGAGLVWMDFKPLVPSAGERKRVEGEQDSGGQLGPEAHGRINSSALGGDCSGG